MQLEDSIGKDMEGVEIKVTHWMPVEDSPNDAPELPAPDRNYAV